MLNWLALVGVAALVFVSGCTTQSPVEGELDAFAQCLYDSGVRMYGSFTCSICEKERQLFGSSFEYIQEIECHPQGENPQTDLCLEKGIEKTPTWIREVDGVEVGRLLGYQTAETLAEFSGCSLEE